MNTNLLSSVIGELLHQCYLHPVRLTLHVKPFGLVRDDIREMVVEHLEDVIHDKISAEYPDQSYELTNKIAKEQAETETERTMKELDSALWSSWESLAFGPEIKTLTITSNHTGNDDSRGGGCGHLKLSPEDFTWTETNPTGITLRNLTEAVYRLKGSKYDFWYELYSGISVVDTVGDHIYLKADFGYGS